MTDKKTVNRAMQKISVGLITVRAYIKQLERQCKALEMHRDEVVQDREKLRAEVKRYRQAMVERVYSQSGQLEGNPR